MRYLKNSRLLDALLENAKEIKAGKEGTITAERFVIASIDYVLNGAAVGNDPEGKALSEYISDNIKNVGDLRAYLIEYVSSQNDISISDNLYFQNRLIELRRVDENDPVKEVTPEMLLRSIMKNPTETIGRFMDGKNDVSNDSSEEPETKSPKTQSEIDAEIEKLFDDLFGDLDDDDDDDDDEAPDFEAKPDPGADDKEKESDTGAVVSENQLFSLTEKTKHIREFLLESVLGQNHAVNTFVSGYFQSELLAMTDKKRFRPKATFLFAGPPGVGKTFLAQKAAEALELPFRCFDMSGYSDNEAPNEFAGTDKVYKNGSPGNVTSFVDENPGCVLLFDEIEKAHLNVIHLFLQILDAGRLRDSYTDKEVSFRDAILIFTTNAGKRLYTQSDATDFSSVSRKVILKALEKDVNPTTGESYFPGAICSRFASGNVLMFNHITAHNLRDIAGREILRHKGNFEKETGITINIDDRVFSALLFSEGGSADARTVRSRGEAFFHTELFEMLRLLDEPGNRAERNIESIDITIDLPTDNGDIAKLFVSDEQFRIAAAADPETVACLKESVKSAEVFACTDEDGVNTVMRQNNVQMALVDLNYGIKDSGIDYMNAEDVDSVGRDLLWCFKERYPEVPVYLIGGRDHRYSEEEKISFLNLGVRGFIDIDDVNGLEKQLLSVCDSLYQQKSINELTKANKVLTFETAQLFDPDSGRAEIRLFDFALETAVDSEDSNDILSNLSKPDVKFSQVIGAEDAKDELRFFVDYLKNPKKYIGKGLRPPKGIILYGPPGTGKTMLAKAMASEADVTFIAAEGNQFLQQYIGQGKERVHDLFRIARRYAPSILFVDEIDAIAKERTGGEHSAANGEDVLTAFLAEMDGFKNDPSRPVFVLAATNFDVEPGSPRSLDSALMRRFDRKIYVDLPTKDERIRYLKMKIEGSSAFDVSDAAVENLAVRSTGSSLAELENIIELALRDAMRTDRLMVDDGVLENAFETYSSGEEKKWSPELLERTARHEAGHTLLSWLLGEKPSYVTIVARGDHGGYMQHGDSEDKKLFTKKELLARIRISLGGRAAELVYYGNEDGLSTGAGSDLVQATAVAKNLVCSYGMDPELGPAVITSQELSSGEIAARVRESVNAILSAEMENAVKLISENRDKIDGLVAELLVKNHLAEKQIEAVLK